MRSSIEAAGLPVLTGSGDAALMGIRRVAQSLFAVGYGLTYDAIFAAFPPYRALRGAVLERVRRAVGTTKGAGPPRVLELGCGTGNISLALAERGYSVVGEDPYDRLVERARRKAGARRLSNVTFRSSSADDGGYDLVVSVHVLYAQPDPIAELGRAFSRLRGGGHAIIVNFGRSAPVAATAREVWSREGAGAALHSLLWLLPNALFNLLRGRRASHYWTVSEFRSRLEDVGFEVLDMRPTFLNGISLLAWCRKN